MTSFRFLHAADIHLDSPLKGLARHEGRAVDVIQKATRLAFDQLISLAIEEQVDFLIIAGDLYDGDWRDYNTGLFFTAQMGRLNSAGIPVYLLHGNHDADSRITRRLDLPNNVERFGTRKPQTFKMDELSVVLHGQSFQQRDVKDNLALAYPDPLPDVFNIGVLHTGLGGMGGHENYAPCSLGDLVNKGYDYWALGHVHQAAVLHENPHIVFPGNLQGRHVRETGTKGASLVSVEDGQVMDLVTVPCDVVRWVVLPVPLDDAAGMNDAYERIQSAVEHAVANHTEGRLLACRLQLTGRTDLHDRLIVSEEQLLAEARATALAFGDEVAWIEKIAIETEGTVSADALAAREDSLGELQRMLAEASADAELVERLKNDIGELIRKLPPEIRTDPEDDILKAAIDGDYAAVISAVTPYLSSRLIAEED